MTTAARSYADLDAELARLRRDNEMLRRQVDALHDTDKGEMLCRNDELAAEVLELKQQLAALGVTTP